MRPIKVEIFCSDRELWPIKASNLSMLFFKSVKVVQVLTNNLKEKFNESNKFLEYFRSEKFKKIRVFLFNNDYRLDQLIIISIMLFVFFLMYQVIYNSGFFATEKMMIIPSFVLALLISCWISIKLITPLFCVFHNLIRHLLLIHGDKISFFAPDARRCYTGRYLNLPEAELQNYIKNLTEKKMNLSRIRDRFLDSRAYIDLGAGLFARVPCTAISKIVE